MDEWVSDRQSFEHGFFVFVVTCLVPLLICSGWQIFQLFNPRSNYVTASQAGGLSDSGPQTLEKGQTYVESHIETIAEITAGIAGILLAVVVFSVQLHAQREDEGAFMTRYLVRKHKVPWIIGYALGLTAFNGAVLLIHVLGLSWSWKCVASIDLIGLSFLLVATFWLTYQSLHDATESTFNLGFQLFRRDLSKIIAEDSFLNDLFVKFSDILKETLLSQSYWIIYSSRLKRFIRAHNRSENPIEFYVSAKGIVTDINVPCLNGLNEILAQVARQLPNFSAEIMLSPGSIVENHPALVLNSAESDEVNDLDADLEASSNNSADVSQAGKPALRLLFDDLTSRDIQNLLERIFITEARDGRDRREFNDFFERFGVHLQHLPKSGSAVLLRQLLEKYEEIIELTASEHEKVRPSAMSAFAPRRLTNPLQSTFYDLARLCFASGDQETVESLFDSSKVMYATGVRQTASAICYWSLNVLSFIYFLGTKSTSEAVPLGELRELYDRLLHYIYFPFESRRPDFAHSTRQDEKSAFSSERSRLDAAIAFNFDIFRRAIEVGAYEHCTQFVDRLFEFREHRFDGGDTYQSAPLEETVETLHDYALVLLIGWCLDVISRSQTSAQARESTSRLILELVEYAPTVEEIIAIWELYHPHRTSDNIDERLRVAFLDNEPESRRVGKIYTGFGHSDWQRRGVLALMLLVEGRPRLNFSEFFPSAPGEFTWDLAGDESVLRATAALPELNIAEADREKRIETVLSLLKVRKRFAEKSTLLSIADEAIDSRRIVEFKQDAIDA